MTEASGPGGWADEAILLTPYQPQWPERFERERSALSEAIGPWVVGGIHHVGSTAVPGLTAKPIIDILVGVADLESSRGTMERLADIEYLYAPYLDDRMHWFCKPHPARRTHHLHLVPVDSNRYLEELAFRDSLRADPGLAGEYSTLKQRLAQLFRNDRTAYTKAKSDFIGAALVGRGLGSA
jgi:GrpB-like predicted nucleotidyltransferase (UPF0157 family)